MSAAIRLLPSGKSFTAEANESVLEAGLRAGVALPFRCSNGTCGQCKARVVSGQTRALRFHDYAIAEAEKREGYVLLCSVQALSDLQVEVHEVEGVDEIPYQELDARVQRVQRLREDFMVLQVRTPRNRTLSFLPGQSVRIGLRGLLPRYRSIASCPCQGGQLEFHVRRAPGDAFSEYVFGSLKPPEPITLMGPEGRFSFAGDGERPLLFFAYDTGFAPIKSLVEHAISVNDELPMRLYWMALRQGEHYLENLCRSWTDALDDFVYVPLTSIENEAASGRRLHWNEAAALDQVVAENPDMSALDVYVAGPQGLVSAARTRFVEAGLPPGRFFAETLRYF